MSTTKKPAALVVHESWFGNTAAVADAVAQGLSREGFEVACVDVARAPRGELTYDLIVVGAPTHAFGLSRIATREDAVERGAKASDAAFGIREWLEQLPQDDTGICAAAFDTRADKARRLPFAAAPAARRRLTKHGYPLIGDQVGFLVEGTAGPLLEGELERARAWGREVGVATRDHLARHGAAGGAAQPAARAAELER